MRQKSVPEKEPATQVVKNIRRATRRHFSAEDRIRIVPEGLRGDGSIAALPPRGDRPEPLLPAVEAAEEATGWRYGPGRDVGRGQGPASRDQRAEGSRGRTDPRKSSAQKKRDGGWGGRHMSTLPPRSLRSSGWSRSPPAGAADAGKGWHSAPPSTAGTICTKPVGRKPWTTDIPNQMRLLSPPLCPKPHLSRSRDPSRN